MRISSTNGSRADPDKVVPDSDMAFHVEKADERREIIAYLKRLSGK
jgi:cytochrome c2